MPAFYPEGDDPRVGDAPNRSLQKINSLLNKIESKNGFSISEYDTIQLSNYDEAGNVGTVTYRKNGDVVATLTLTYNGSDQLTSVAKS
jgi:hypothetical protein